VPACTRFPGARDVSPERDPHPSAGPMRPRRDCHAREDLADTIGTVAIVARIPESALTGRRPDAQGPSPGRGERELRSVLAVPGVDARACLGRTRCVSGWARPLRPRGEGRRGPTPARVLDPWDRRRKVPGTTKSYRELSPQAPGGSRTGCIDRRPVPGRARPGLRRSGRNASLSTPAGRE